MFFLADAKALVDFYRVQADDGLGGAFQDVTVVAGTYTTVEWGEPRHFGGRTCSRYWYVIR